jgi:hypothetical protein
MAVLDMVVLVEPGVYVIASPAGHRGHFTTPLLLGKLTIRPGLRQSVATLRSLRYFRTTGRAKIASPIAKIVGVGGDITGAGSAKAVLREGSGSAIHGEYGILLIVFQYLERAIFKRHASREADNEPGLVILWPPFVGREGECWHQLIARFNQCGFDAHIVEQLFNS